MIRVVVESASKRRLGVGELDAVVREALGVGLAAHVELTEGMFNTAYRLTTEDGRESVLKVAPPAGVPVMTYERDLMRTEALAFSLMAGRGLPVPSVLLATDDLLLMTALRGTPWNAAALSESSRRSLRRELGGIVRELHAITGDVFGYPQGPNGSTWRSAFLAMVDAVLADARRFGVELPDVRPAFAARAHLLDEVTSPVLVHFDLWEANIFVADGRIEGIIDPERAMFGDPLAELATVALFADVDADFLAGYGRAEPFTPAEETRIALYRAYLCLIMIVEGVPRGYSGPEHDSHVAFFRQKLGEYLS